MTEAVKLLTFIYIMFVIILALSGYLVGIISEIVYYLAFIIPVSIGFYSSIKLKSKREEIAGVAETPDTLLNINLNNVKALIPLVAPTVMIVFLISLITTLILFLFGVSSPAIENKNLVLMLVLHALVPAVFEEALFRYIPMKLLLPYSKRWCIIYSAMCFALIHCNFSQMPYAFAAGIIFMTVDMCIGNVWPSVILHFANNAASVIWIKYCSGMKESIAFILMIAILSIISLAFIYKKRDMYKAMFKGVFAKGDDFFVTYVPIALVLVTCYFATMNLFK